STALAPSAASPITRMWGARESDSRRPSRTTSWSSTIRVVISSGMARGILCGEQGKLFRRRRRRELDGPAVAYVVDARELGDLRPHGLRVVRAEVGAAAIQLLVLREELRPVAREALEEVLARAGTEE